MTGPTEKQHRHMFALWKVAGVTDRDDRLALTGAIVGRPLATSNDLDTREADAVIEYLRVNADAGLLADKAAAWLAARHAPLSGSDVCSCRWDRDYDGSGYIAEADPDCPDHHAAPVPFSHVPEEVPF